MKEVQVAYARRYNRAVCRAININIYDELDAMTNYYIIGKRFIHGSNIQLSSLKNTDLIIEYMGENKHREIFFVRKNKTSLKAKEIALLCDPSLLEFGFRVDGNEIHTFK